MIIRTQYIDEGGHVVTETDREVGDDADLRHLDSHGIIYEGSRMSLPVDAKCSHGEYIRPGTGWGDGGRGAHG